RRRLGRAVGLHLDDLPGGRPALPDVRAVAEAAEDALRRHHGDVLRLAQCHEGRALCRARPVLDQGARHLAGDVAARARRQPARLLPGAPHLAGPVLSPDADPDAGHLGRADARGDIAALALMTEARLPATFSPGGPPNGENAHRHTLRSWSRPQPGQSPAADAAWLPRAGGGCVPAAHGDRPRTAAAHLRR